MTTGTHVDDAPITDEPAEASAPRTAPPARATWLLRGGLVVTTLAAVVFAFLWVQATGRVDELEALDQDRETVSLQAIDVARALTNWDAADGMDAELATLRDLGSGAFLDEIDLQFGGDLAAQLQSLGLSSTGTVEEVFVQSLEGDEASVYATVTQQYHTQDRSTAPLSLPVTMQLERVDGAWLVRVVTVPADDQLADLLNPSTGSES